MPILLLHDTNLGVAKAHLRTLLPGVRSAHLTEALASGLGFRTHAALLAALAAEADRRPALAEIDDNAFAARLGALGYPAPPAALLGGLVRSDVIPDRPYAEFPDRDRRANDAHFAHCDRHSRPMVMVRTARSYATVEWDCITTNDRPNNYPYFEDEGRAILDEMIRLFQLRVKDAPGKPHHRATTFTGWAYKLLPDAARQLAEDYFRLLYLPLRAA